MPSWAEQLIPVLSSEDPFIAAAAMPGPERQVDDLSAELIFDAPPAAGVLADYVILIDRAFRLGARFVESEMSAHEFRAGRRKGTPVAEGMLVEVVEAGSLRIPLRPSRRIRKSMAAGVVVVGTAVAYLNSGFDFFDHLKGADEPKPQIFLLPEQQHSAPHRLMIRLRRGDEVIEVILDGGDREGYRLKEVKPLRELEP